MANREIYLQKKYKDILTKELNSYYIIYHREDDNYNIYDCYRSIYLLEKNINFKEINENILKKIIDEYHEKYYSKDEESIHRAKRIYNKGDIVYYVADVKSVKDTRYGIYIHEIKKSKEKYHVSRNNEVLFWRSLFDNFDDAKVICKRINKLFYPDFAEEDIIIVDERKQYKLIIEQLSLF